ncbi:MAG: SigE family RNA polymerase sigma factor [Hamadaea sp.]|uniref:SigE family RNA polymerase sigma factor n=1 Tax=Hamadaea sp. TaxID=2024425 RepID=UPI0017E045CA|nr:SigE family RNA polymerase sigma factor [Hamadaea sp.]NUR71799.1 SigE family RNA polymerase sigma factor [Hamadaea sp.]NUT23677.1 SigE family RNA polymerase sigma factor [Hamadaea sp.]
MTEAGQTKDAEFAEYFSARAAQLRRIAYALCGDWHLAEDLVQHTFVQLYRHWRRIQPATLDAYTRRTLLNAYLSNRRVSKRERVVADVPDHPAPGQGGTDTDVLAMLAQLPPRQRAVIVLRHLEDLPIAEVAELVGMSEGSVKSQSSRGLALLRSRLVKEA